MGGGVSIKIARWNLEPRNVCTETHTTNCIGYFCCPTQSSLVLSITIYYNAPPLITLELAFSMFSTCIYLKCQECVKNMLFNNNNDNHRPTQVTDSLINKSAKTNDNHIVELMSMKGLTHDAENGWWTLFQFKYSILYE